MYKKLSIFFKRNKMAYLQIIGHLLIVAITIIIVSSFNEYYNFVIDAKQNIIDLLFLLITIFVSLLFVIKQIYINRLSRKYISSSFNIKMMYKIICLLISSTLLIFNLLKSYQNIVVCCIFVSIIYFFITLFLDLKKVELDEYLEKKIKKITRLINESNNDKLITTYLYVLDEIYNDCLEKNEINISIKIINSFEDFFKEKLCNKNKEILLQNRNESELEEYYNEQIRFLTSKLTNEKSTMYKKIDNRIFCVLINCLNYSYACDDNRLIDILEEIIVFFVEDKGCNFSDDTYRVILIKLLDDCDNKEKYISKLKFLIRLFNKAVEKNRMSNYFPLLDYLLYILTNNKKINLIDEEITDIYMKTIFNSLSFQKADYLFFVKLKNLDEKLYGSDNYGKLIEFYKEITDYSNIIRSESSALYWFEFFEELLKLGRKDYYDDYYTVLFDILEYSIEKYGLLKGKLFYWIDYSVFKKYKERILFLLHKTIKFEKNSYLFLLLSEINKILIETKKNEVLIQKELLTVYETAMIMFSNKECDEKNFYLITDNLRSLINEMEKQDNISHNLFSYFLQFIKVLTENFIEENNKWALQILGLLYEFTRKDDTGRFNKKEFKLEISEVYYELAFLAAERNEKEIIKAASNHLGWIVKSLLDSNDNKEAEKVFDYGFEIFDMLIRIRYENNTINFVGTFVITIGSYCFSDCGKQSLGNKIISKIKTCHKSYLNNALLLRNPVRKTWNDVLNCDFERGYSIFKEKMGKSKNN